MALVRVITLLLLLFAGITSLIWVATSTPFFNKQRLLTIVKWSVIGTVALALTGIAFALIFSFDHTL